MKNKKSLLIALSLILVIVIAGITYALFNQTDIQVKENVLDTSCLKIVFDEDVEGDFITLKNAIPITDEEAMTLPSYTFTVTNKCDTEASYNINIDISKDSTIRDDAIKAMETRSVSKILNNSIYNTSFDDNEFKSSYTIYTGVLGAASALNASDGESKTHSVRIWVGEHVTDSMRETFKGKISVVAVPAA